MVGVDRADLDDTHVLLMSEGSRLTVLVTEAATRRPLPGAEVIQRSGEESSVRVTNAGGLAEFGGRMLRAARLEDRDADFRSRYPYITAERVAELLPVDYYVDFAYRFTPPSRALFEIHADPAFVEDARRKFIDRFGEPPPSAEDR